MASGNIKKVVVVGAGPAGLLVALQLARHGITVEVLDLADKLDEQPRATHYGAPAVYELGRAGVLEEIQRQGFLPKGVVWRKLDGTVLAGLDCRDLGDEYPNNLKLTCLPLNRVSQILLDALAAQQAHATVRWSHKVVGLGQDADKAWVEVETPAGKQTVEADFVVGCDGASSQIRRSLFGDWEFPGRTWDEQIIATNTYIDLDQYGWHDSNFIVHPEHYFMAARIGKGTGREALWRITYGEVPGLSRDEYRARLSTKFETMLPGHPKPDQYDVANFSPYKIHQRCAEKLRVGRFLLAADAAHLCNPFGGLGLTGGIVDVGGLVDCLVGIHSGRAQLDILDKYDEVRRDKYRSIVDPISSQNFRRLWDQDPDKALQTDSFLQMCKRAETDKKFSRELQEGVMALQHDFTQYYSPPPMAAVGT